jgi:hypothetical protein
MARYLRLWEMFVRLREGRPAPLPLWTPPRDSLEM